MENKELRMYGLVPYNISPIQQSIQFGHAVVEYGLKYFDTPEYQDWAHNWKTFIILNGGTSNHTQNRYAKTGNTLSEIDSFSHIGSMEQHLKELMSRGIKVGEFYEPDLNDMLSAIVFIVDEQVFNRELYPDFKLNISPTDVDRYQFYKTNPLDIINFPVFFDEVDKFLFEDWVGSVGGKKNVFLRDFTKRFRLA